MAADYVQVALEETPRYEGAVTTTPYRISTNVTYLPVTSAKLAPGRDDEDRADELRGIEDGGVPNIVTGFQPSGSLAMRAYLNAMPWLLALNGWSWVYTAGAGGVTDPDSGSVPVGANKWVFTRRSGNTPQTGQVIIAAADEGIYLKSQGTAITSLGITSGGEVTADLASMVLARTADPSLTPSYDVPTILPVIRGDLTIDWIGGGGACTDFSITSSLGVERDWSIGALSSTPSKFARGMFNADALPRVSGRIAKRNLVGSEWDYVLNGATFSAKARWKSSVSVGVTAAKYALWVEMPACQIMEGDPEDVGGTKRAIGAEYQFEGRHDTVTGYSTKITIVNAVTAINTYV